MKFRHTNFMRLIYATLLALPFVAILSRVIYVQSNKNAYQSAQITQTTYVKSYYDNVYRIYTHSESDDDELNTYDYIEIEGLLLNLVDIDFDDFAIDTTYPLQSNNYLQPIYLRVDPDSSLYYANIQYNSYSTGADFEIYAHTLILDIQITRYYAQGNTTISTLEDYDYMQKIDNTYFFYDEIESTTLDNVFEYSVNKFIENNNFGKINLFQWTTNLFFDSNDVNNMYVGFINWYLNYTLLVSATYILFLVLMWFINYARRLLERGMNYDF